MVQIWVGLETDAVDGWYQSHTNTTTRHRATRTHTRGRSEIISIYVSFTSFVPDGNHFIVASLSVTDPHQLFYIRNMQENRNCVSEDNLRKLPRLNLHFTVREREQWWRLRRLCDGQIVERWGGGEGVRADTQSDNQERFCLHYISTCLSVCCSRGWPSQLMQIYATLWCFHCIIYDEKESTWSC